MLSQGKFGKTKRTFSSIGKFGNVEKFWRKFGEGWEFHNFNGIVKSYIVPKWISVHK